MVDAEKESAQPDQKINRPDEGKKGPKEERGFPVHPLCLAAFPVLSVYSSNLAIVPLEDLWRPLAVAVGYAAALMLLFWPIFRNIRQGATAASVMVVTTFLYGNAAKVATVMSSPWVWWMCAAAVALYAGMKGRTTRVLNIVSVLLVLVTVGNVAYGHMRIAMDISKIRKSIGTQTGAVSGPSPDIFYVILDGYGRSDTLKRKIGFDNSPFIDALKQRGFYVADKSHSNYVQTEISLSSSLNLQLIPDLLPDMPRDTTDRKEFDGLISGNELARYLRRRGYRTIAITSGYPPVEFPTFDMWVTHASSLSLFETTLLQMTPFVPEKEGISSMFNWRYATLHAAFNNLADLGQPSERPKFVFCHILAPHPPFVLTADDKFVRQKGPFGYWDGSDFMTYCGTPAYYAKGYAGQAADIDTLVLRAVDALLAHGNKPVIVIQGDHGSKKGLDQNILAKTDVTECFPNLAAFYVPDTVRSQLYPGITPVNEFRVILNGLFGENLPLLPDHSWYSPFGNPLEFTDVTNRVVGH